jgi:ornithine carbamoyltransferase
VTTHFLTIQDWQRQDVEALLNRAMDLKRRKQQGLCDQPLKGKTLGLLFEKASTRTRVSFEAAMAQLGGTPLFISKADTQIARNEPVQDTARVLSRYLDAVAIRTFSQQWLEEFAGWSSIPVINALTDSYHPCQVLSDLLTIQQIKGRCRGLKIAWVGDGNNMCHSWITAAGVLGLELAAACPPGYQPATGLVDQANAGGGRVTVVAEPEEAVSGADVINTDVWASMGQEDQQAARAKAFAGYRVDDRLLGLAKADAIVMHCLPAHRGEEISEAVLESRRCVIWDQAENKLHLAKALLEKLILPGPKG